MRARILVLLVLLLLVLFPAVNVFGAACAGNYATSCGPKTSATCSNYYSLGNATGYQCAYTIACKGFGGSCTPQCTANGRTATGTTCGNLTTGVCNNYFYDHATTDKVCKTFLGSCVGKITCIPEFFGIEFDAGYFPEMQISTGIIALTAAIALPTFLLRKKR